MTNISCIVTLHSNPFTCGIARFNKSLAEALGIPMIPWSEYHVQPVESALISIKLSEFAQEDIRNLHIFLSASPPRFNVFLHGYMGVDTEVQLLGQAERVFAGNCQIVSDIAAVRRDAIAAFAPGIQRSNKQRHPDIRLLTFGMAHKISGTYYRKLAELLSQDSRQSVLEISTALHTGTSFDEDFFTVADEISSVFMGAVTFLGFLADGEISMRLSAATALVAFFPNGARENNTSVMGAMAHECPVITNLDSFSPVWMQHGETVFDIKKLDRFPTDQQLKDVGRKASSAVGAFTFDSLAMLLLTD